jgi:hypothetical protein
LKADNNESKNGFADPYDVFPEIILILIPNYEKSKLRNNFPLVILRGISLQPIQMNNHNNQQNHKYPPEQATLNNILFMWLSHPFNIKSSNHVRLLLTVSEIDVTKESEENRGDAGIGDKDKAQEE